jgi:hypothetical protein
MPSVSGISAATAGAYQNTQATGAVPSANGVSSQSQSDFALQVTVSVMKLMMNEEKSISQGILDMLV